MPSRRAVVFSLAGLLVAPGRVFGARKRTSPRSPRRPFFDDYRISRYLQLATEVQTLSSDDARAKRLRAHARDPSAADEIFPLCRMLFLEGPTGFFRAPGLGAPVFIDGDSVGNWPLEPIGLFRNVPILIVRGYALGGLAEAPSDYLEYCLQECRWRDPCYAPVDSQTLADVVERFIQAHDAITDPDWLRRQAR